MINSPKNSFDVVRNRNRAYTNGEITIYWQPMECVHATTCYHELREVFDPARRPWVNPLGASTSRILDIIERCPTRALTFKWNDPARNQSEKSHKLFDGETTTIFPDVNSAIGCTITYRANGPAIVSGEFSIRHMDDVQPIRTMQMVSLCRCGASGNMPFCDGTHFKIGFKG